MGVFLQSAVEAPKVHETSWMVYKALIIQNAIWFHIEKLNFTKKLFSLYTHHSIFEEGVGGQKNFEFFFILFFPWFLSQKGIQIHLGRLTFLEKKEVILSHHNINVQLLLCHWLSFEMSKNTNNRFSRFFYLILLE